MEFTFLRRRRGFFSSLSYNKLSGKAKNLKQQLEFRCNSDFKKKRELFQRMKAINHLSRPPRKDVNLLGVFKWRKGLFWRWAMAKH